MANWAKDRNRALKKRAATEDFDEQQRLRTSDHNSRVRIFQEKTKLRALGEEALRQYLQKDKSP
jgi:hypothetical protein